MVESRARAIMVLGTASNAGKSIFVTALCRLLANAGVRVAPFKAQNMSLNSAATPEGLEIGRAQALQAEAARIAPSADMNPVLIKPTSHMQSQVIVHGRIAGTLHARDYLTRNRERLWPAICESYDRLSRAYDVIVLEGAGSPAEINLRAGDVVNMAMAHEADARCMLVGDIDRGGFFASVFGTLALLDDRDRARIDGWAINRFRGDASLLRSGIEMLEARCGVPCLGIVPHLGELGLDEEDSVPLERRRTGVPWSAQREGDRLRIAVIPLPHLANFTDFDALAQELSVDLRYTLSGNDIAHADVVMLPGTKDTIADLQWLRSQQLDRPIIASTASILGICGGMQMLGAAIHDPHGVESGGSHHGLGMLDAQTTFAREKITIPVRGRSVEGDHAFTGYEIHVGDTHYGDDADAFAMIRRSGDANERRDGARSKDGRICGTYVHGLFDDDDFRHAWLREQRDRARLSPLREPVFVHAQRESRLDALAQAVGDALDLRMLMPELEVTR